MKVDIRLLNESLRNVKSTIFIKESDSLSNFVTDNIESYEKLITTVKNLIKELDKTQNEIADYIINYGNIGKEKLKQDEKKKHDQSMQTDSGLYNAEDLQTIKKHDQSMQTDGGLHNVEDLQTIEKYELVILYLDKMNKSLISEKKQNEYLKEKKLELEKYGYKYDIDLDTATSLDQKIIKAIARCIADNRTLFHVRIESFWETDDHSFVENICNEIKNKNVNESNIIDYLEKYKYKTCSPRTSKLIKACYLELNHKEYLTQFKFHLHIDKSNVSVPPNTPFTN